MHIRSQPLWKVTTIFLLLIWLKYIVLTSISCQNVIKLVLEEIEETINYGLELWTPVARKSPFQLALKVKEYIIWSKSKNNLWEYSHLSSVPLDMYSNIKALMTLVRFHILLYQNFWMHPPIVHCRPCHYQASCFFRY